MKESSENIFLRVEKIKKTCKNTCVLGEIGTSWLKKPFSEVAFGLIYRGVLVTRGCF